MAIGAFLTVLARGPIGFDWLTPVIVKSLDELYAQRYDSGSAALRSRVRITDRRSPPRG